MKKSKLYSLMSTALLAGTMFANSTVSANAIDETGDWSKPTVILGQNVDSVQKDQLLRDFGIDSSKPNSYLEGIATSEDMSKYLGIDGGSSMYSSVSVVNKGKGSNVTVKVVDKDLITKVTADQYANAAITAGAKDVEITVSAPFAVTGESALTGVYKAFEANGEALDTERTKVAQEEIAVVTDISTENAETESFDSALLDAALAEIKIELGKYKQSNDEVADESKVAEIVNSALKKNNLEGILSEEQISKLVSFAKSYQNTSAVDSEEVLKAFNSFKDGVTEKASALFESAKENGLFEKLGDFFVSVWNTIKDVFKK